jgi:hypothetical protein
MARLAVAVKPFNRQDHIRRRNTRRQTINSRLADRVLTELQRIADETGARLFPVSGTLLGLYRNGGVLAHDFDIDVGLFAWDEAVTEFLKAAKQSPFFVSSKLVCLPEGYRSINPWLPDLEGGVVSHKMVMKTPEGSEADTVEVDIFLHFRCENLVAHGIANRLWLNSEFGLVRRQFGDHSMLVPADTPKYLTENYGDFKVEKTEFENLVDCPNCVLVNGVDAVFYVAKMRKIYLLANWTARIKVLDEIYHSFIKQLLLKRQHTPGWKIRSAAAPED